MEKRTFKQLIQADVRGAFLNDDEFSDSHTINGKEMSITIDENEAIEREKRMMINVDGIYVKQKLIYVAAAEYGQLPSVGTSILLDNRRYIVMDAIDEEGIYSITLEENTSNGRKRPQI